MRKLTVVLMAALFVQQASAGLLSNAVSAGVGYLFGRGSSSSTQVDVTVDHHTTNVTNVYVDTSGIEREIKALTEATRLAGPNFHLESADKADYTRHYNLTSVGPIIGIDIHSADSAAFVQQYGKAELQKIIEDRIRDKALSIYVTNAVLETLKSSCAVPAGQELSLFNIPQLMHAIEAKSGINTYTSLDPNAEYDLLSDKAKEEGNITNAQMNAYLNNIITAVSTWYSRDGQNITFSELKNAIDRDLDLIKLNSLPEMLNEQKNLLTQAKPRVFVNQAQHCIDRRDIRNNFTRRLRDKNEEKDAFIAENEPSVTAAQQKAQEAKATLDEAIKAIEQDYQKLSVTNLELVKSVSKVSYDFLGAQEYTVVTKNGKKFSFFMNSELEGPAVKTKINEIIKDQILSALALKYNDSFNDYSFNKFAISKASTKDYDFLREISKFSLEENYHFSLSDKIYNDKPIREINSNFNLQPIVRNALVSEKELLSPFFANVADISDKFTAYFDAQNESNNIGYNYSREIRHFDSEILDLTYSKDQARSDFFHCERQYNNLVEDALEASKVREQIELFGAPQCSEETLASLEKVINPNLKELNFSIFDGELSHSGVRRAVFFTKRALGLSGSNRE